MSNVIPALLSLIPIGFMLYAFFDREMDRIRQKRAAARRKAYRARKEDIERQARRRL